MITILHGENTTQSRQKLFELLQAYGQKEFALNRLEAAKLDQKTLEEELGTIDLFESKKLIVIEELHSLPVSKKRTALLQQLASASDQEIVLWEKKTLTKKMLSLFPSAQVYSFKASKVLFTWLESLGSTQSAKAKLTYLHDAIRADSDQFCFIMAIWYVRLLLQEKAPSAASYSIAPPFMRAKLQAQAGKIPLEKLLNLHAELLAYDVLQKTGKPALTATQQLDLLTLTL